MIKANNRGSRLKMTPTPLSPTPSSGNISVGGGGGKSPLMAAAVRGSNSNKKGTCLARWGPWMLILFALAVYLGSMNSFYNLDPSEYLSTIDGKEKGVSNQLASGKKRVAIVVAGTLQRYMFNSTLEHLIKPLAEEQGHMVDYYLTLTTAFAKPYRSESGYMDRIHWDPLLTQGAVVQDPPSAQQAATILQQEMDAAGAIYLNLILRDHMDIDANELLSARRAKALQEHPNEDPDLRFPLLDLRSPDVKTRTTAANKNLLRLHLAVQEQWEALTKREMEKGFLYDYVVFLRDDSFWLEDFNLDRLVSTSPTADLYVLACDARNPAMLPEEINDHAVVANRKSSAIFGKYFEEMLGVNIAECQASISKAVSKGGYRGCNSEMLLKFVVEKKHNLAIQFVGQALIPFQRSVNVVTKDNKVVQCYHKFCQSKEDRLDKAEDTTFMKRCKELTF